MLGHQEYLLDTLGDALAHGSVNVPASLRTILAAINYSSIHAVIHLAFGFWPKPLLPRANAVATFC